MSSPIDFVILGLLALAPQSPVVAPEVRCDAGRVTIAVVDAPLRALMDRIAEACDVEVLGRDQLSGSVTATIDTTAMPQALDVLLAGYNYLIGAKAANTSGGPQRWQVRVLSKMGAEPVLHKSLISGPVLVPALEAAHQQELADADPVDPEEQEEREAHLASLIKDGTFSANATEQSLIELFEDDDNPLVRRRALAELNSRVPERTLRLLLESLADEDLSEEAVGLLSRRKDPESLTQLGELLVKEPDLTARVAAFRALAIRADPSSVKYVQAVANDRHQVIRDAAAQFLTEMEHRRRARDGR